MKVSLKITQNFTHNLEAIEAFLLEAEAPSAFNRLIDKLLSSVFTSLQCFPKIGLDYLQKPSHSLQGRNHLKKLKKRLKSMEVREYIFDDYLLLYALRHKQIFLLSIKHHRQLTFELDFKNLWL